MARPKKDSSGLTETELLLMNILWQIGVATVHEVLETLQAQQGKNYAYTTVSTMLRVLEKKGFINSEKEGRGHRYQAVEDQQSYQEKAVGQVVDQVFSGQPTSLVKSLLGSGKISRDELEEIQKMLLEKKND